MKRWRNYQTTFALVLHFSQLWNVRAVPQSDGYSLMPNNNRCIGKIQIPINPESATVHERPYDRIEFKNFDVIPESTTWENNGKMITITMNFTEDKIPNISQGPLNSPGPYRLFGLYFHWIKTASKKYGYKNLTFPAELHIIFYDEKYSSLFEALNAVQGAVVMSVGMKISPEGNSEFDSIMNVLTVLRDEYASVLPPDTQVPLNSFMPRELKTYITYSGSLLSLGCLAAVMWVDFQQPIAVKPNFVEKFIDMKASDGWPLMKNVFPAYKNLPGLVTVPEKKFSSGAARIPQSGNPQPGSIAAATPATKAPNGFESGGMHFAWILFLSSAMIRI